MIDIPRCGAEMTEPWASTQTDVAHNPATVRFAGESKYGSADIRQCFVAEALGIETRPAQYDPSQS